MQPMQVTFFIIGTIVIIVGAYYVTYFIGVKSSGVSRGRGKGRSISILDRFAISKDKSFCLVEIAGKVYVVAVTNQSVTLLDTLDAATFAGNAAERGGASSWRQKGGGTSGGAYSGRMTRRLASFMAARMGRPDPFAGEGSNDAGSEFSGSGEDKPADGADADKKSAGKTPANESFAENLRKAQSKRSGDEE